MFRIVSLHSVTATYEIPPKVRATAVLSDMSTVPPLGDIWLFPEESTAIVGTKFAAVNTIAYPVMPEGDLSRTKEKKTIIRRIKNTDTVFLSMVNVIFISLYEYNANKK